MPDYVTKDGDVLDAIIFTVYGQGPDALQVVLDANPHIRQMPVHLPIGTKISLPLLSETPAKQQVKLWD